MHRWMEVEKFEVVLGGCRVGSALGLSVGRQSSRGASYSLGDLYDTLRPSIHM